MIPINIDLREVINEFKLSAEESGVLVNFVVKEVTTETAKAWANEASRKLSASKGKYIRSLEIVDRGRFKSAIVLKGIVPNMIEQGATPFDMKEGFSKSSKKKFNKNGGWYLTIPFRFANPEAIGESESFSGILPKEIYKEIKKAPARQALDLNKIPKNLQIPKVRGEITPKSKNLSSEMHKPYQHKTSIYSGLQKIDTSSKKAKSSQYMTFRRVGSESASNAFIHKGIVARKLAEAAVSNLNIGDKVSNLVDVYLSKR